MEYFEMFVIFIVACMFMIGFAIDVILNRQNALKKQNEGIIENQMIILETQNKMDVFLSKKLKA